MPFIVFKIFSRALYVDPITLRGRERKIIFKGRLAHRYLISQIYFADYLFVVSGADVYVPIPAVLYLIKYFNNAWNNSVIKNVLLLIYTSPFCSCVQVIG